MSSIYEFTAPLLNGKEFDFGELRGKLVLIVNTASKCGLAPQYEGLEELYKKYKDQGLMILGFPCNQFGNQEPGDGKQISENCLINYGVSFPVFQKVEVNGENESPIFTYLKGELGGWFGSRIKWNFTKFLISRDGTPLKRFSPKQTPKSIESYLISEGHLEEK